MREEIPVEFLVLAREIGRRTVANTLRESVATVDEEIDKVNEGIEIPVAHVEW